MIEDACLCLFVPYMAYEFNYVPYSERRSESRSARLSRPGKPSMAGRRPLAGLISCRIPSSISVPSSRCAVRLGTPAAVVKSELRRTGWPNNHVRASTVFGERVMTEKWRVVRS